MMMMMTLGLKIMFDEEGPSLEYRSVSERFKSDTCEQPHRCFR